MEIGNGMHTEGTVALMDDFHMAMDFALVLRILLGILVEQIDELDSVSYFESSRTLFEGWLGQLALKLSMVLFRRSAPTCNYF